MYLERVEAVVIGAGVVGLACARALALRGREVIVLERHGRFGQETSSRNSEVIHAGLYYPARSLKAALCVEGNSRLYRYCAEHGVSHRRCGKLVVSTSPAQDGAVEALLAKAQANGVDDARLLAGREAMACEPALRCSAALLSPSTGIIDSHGLMLALIGDAERSGAALAFRCDVEGIQARPGDFVLAIDNQGERLEIATRIVVNAAGLWSPQLAARIDGLAEEHVPRSFLAKGNYFSLGRRAPFSRLIYPVPEPGGLGTHLTLDLDGQARFGPDVEWVDRIDYTVEPSRADRFYGEIRKYWPSLPDGALQPDYCGIRPKLSGPGEEGVDFLVQGPSTHGLDCLVNLFGIESPGLTACLPIADAVCDQLGLPPEDAS